MDIPALYASLQLYKKAPAKFDADSKKKLESDTERFLDAYLAETESFETDSAPELLVFLQKAAVFDSLKDKISQARQKLHQSLTRFDERYGLTGLERVAPETIERNIDKLSLLAQMPVKSRPAFKRLFDIMAHIDLTDENGNSLGQAGRDRIETTVAEAARTDAFFSLLGSSEITVDGYFDLVRDAMQIHLINLFFAEAIAPHYPLNDADAGKMADYMEKLTALIK